MSTPAMDYRGSDSREIFDLNEEPEIAQGKWNEMLMEDYEPSFADERAPEPMYEAPAPTAEYIQQGIEQAQYYANTKVEKESKERDIKAALAILDVDAHIRYNRDMVSTPEEAQTESKGLFKSKRQRHAKKVSRMSERQLIQAESEIGRTLFGPIDKNLNREFFNLDENSWIWHEEWIDGSKQKQARTTRYDVRGTEVIKAQDGEKRVYVTGDELQNLMLATRLYYDRVTRAIYHRDPATGRKLVDIL